MSDQLTDEQKLYYDAYLCGHEDIFVLTQGGAVRRVSMPYRLSGYAAWLMRPGTDIEDGFFDKHACEWASREDCSYGDAMRDLVDRYFDREPICRAYLDDGKSGRLDEIEARFREAQKQLEKQWREAHNEWRKNLPFATD